MTDLQHKMMATAGLKPEDFEPKPSPVVRLENVEHRTDALETTTDDMILLMAELIGGN